MSIASGEGVNVDTGVGTPSCSGVPAVSTGSDPGITLILPDYRGCVNKSHRQHGAFPKRAEWNSTSEAEKAP